MTRGVYNRIEERVLGYYRSALGHRVTRAFREQMVKDFALYDTEEKGHWHDSDLCTMGDRGQPPIIFNVCKIMIDNLSGIEIQSRVRTAIGSSSYNPDDEVLAEALTHWWSDVQEYNRMARNHSRALRDGLICGLGWSEQGYDEKGNRGYYGDYVNPMDVLPDPNDLTPRYQNMKFVCREHYYTPEYVRRRWPKSRAYVSENDDPWEGETPQIGNRMSGESSHSGSSGGSADIKIVEVQYKKFVKTYEVLTKEGKTLETTDVDEARSLASSKRNIAEKENTQIFQAFLYDDHLIGLSPLSFAPLGSRDFSYVPFVYNRRFKDGMPYGLLRSIEPIQKDLNSRLSKYLFEVNRTQIATQGHMNESERKALHHALAINADHIPVPADVEMNIQDKSAFLKASENLIDRYISKMHMISGVSPELLGMQSNATSAIAQNVRQVNAVRSNVFAFDNLAETKERIAEFMVGVLKRKFDENYAVKVIDEEYENIIILNKNNGTGIFENDIRAFPHRIVIEEVPDSKSVKEESKVIIASLLDKPHGPMVLTSETLLRTLGVHNARALSREMSQIMQQNRLEEAQIAGRGEQGGLPSQGSQVQSPLTQGAM